MASKGLEYLSAGTLSYKVALMLFAESFNFLSKECVPLEVNDAKKFKETVTVVRACCLSVSFSMTSACGQHFLEYHFMGNLIYLFKWDFDYQLLVNKHLFVDWF